ncbi:DUF7503 family protein [Natronobiforma cellulositropha]
MADNDKLTTRLASHPRMIGALFAIMLLLSQAGAASAGCQCTFVGP